MKTSLSYLPQIKQDQILQVVDIIKEVVNPEKVILFGSYARNAWVEDKYFENGVQYEYISDYDFLIVTKGNNEKEFVLVDKILNKSRDRFETPVNAIIHDIDYINEGLEIGQYFFTDIAKEGILLYDNNAIEFSKPRELSNKELQKIAQDYFDNWYVESSDFMDGVLLYQEKEKFRKSIFLLHQAAEHFYNTVLLVFTGYKPKTHNLDKLRHFTKQLSTELFTIFPFPVTDKIENHLFNLLKKGYIDARYKNDYVITKDELKILIDRIWQMQKIVQKICLNKIQSMTE